MAAADPAAWHYTSAIDVDEARRVHDAFADALRAWDVEVLYHDEPLPEHSDSVFVFDPVLVTDHGTLVLSMGKERRRGEEEPLARTLQDCGVPVFGRLEGDARVEGGDTLWLDHDTLAVGRGFRTNAEGVRQLRGLLEPVGVSVVDYDLPYFTGPEACLHLLSLISPVDVDLAVAYPPLMPTAFWAELEAPRRPTARGPGRGVRAHAGDQRPHRRSAQVHHAGRKPGDETAARDGRLRGRDLPRRAAVAQGGGRADLSHAAGPSRPGLKDGGRGRRAQSRRAQRGRGLGSGRSRRLAPRADRDRRVSTAKRRRRSDESPPGWSRPGSRLTSGRSTWTSSHVIPTGVMRWIATRRSVWWAGSASRRPAGLPEAPPPAATCC